MTFSLIIKEINQNSKRNILATIYAVIMSSSHSALLMYRLSSLMDEKNFKRIALLIKKRLEINYGVHISLKSKIGFGLKIPHAQGIIIGDGVVIGENVTIYHQVTLGGKNLGDAKVGNYPKIGNNVTIFSGAKLLGDIVVGDNSIIGANSVVTNNVESNSIYAGSPARKIKNIKIVSRGNKDYE